VPIGNPQRIDNLQEAMIFAHSGTGFFSRESTARLNSSRSSWTAIGAPIVFGDQLSMPSLVRVQRLCPTAL
jgi:hypothetical protein